MLLAALPSAAQRTLERAGFFRGEHLARHYFHVHDALAATGRMRQDSHVHGKSYVDLPPTAGASGEAAGGNNAE